MQYLLTKIQGHSPQNILKHLCDDTTGNQADIGEGFSSLGYKCNKVNALDFRLPDLDSVCLLVCYVLMCAINI